MTDIENGLSISGRIDRKTYPTAILQERFPNWGDMTDKQKLNAVRGVKPDNSETVHNVTTARFHEYLVDNLHPYKTGPETNLTIDWMALGTGAAQGTSIDDADLNERVLAKEITDQSDNGTQFLTSTFISSTEANNNTVNEIGLFTGDPKNISDNTVFLVNHARFNDVVKDDEHTITFDVTLTFSDK